MTHLLDIQHPGTGTILISEWLTGTPERTRAAADALSEEWAGQGDGPTARLAQHLFVAEDGSRLLHYAQWTSDEDHLTWARAHRTAVVSRVDTLVPGIVRPGLNRTRLERSVVHDPAGETGVFVVTTGVAVVDVPGLVAEAPGLLAAHVHVTSDGARAVVVAEWADAAAHAAAPAPDAPPRTRYGFPRTLLGA